MSEASPHPVWSALRRLSRLRLPATFEHERRVGLLCAALCQRLGMSSADCAAHQAAAELHDVGKLVLPDAIIDKPDRLTAEEYAQVQGHSQLGHSILSATEEPALALAADVALSHHERWDGSGYPQGLSGTAIPLAARIVAVCDVYSALREYRPYKAPMSHAPAMRLMLLGEATGSRAPAGRFDPALLAVLAGDPDLFRDVLGVTD
ncbi:MAG: HD domain-containing protein [Rhodospirillales bacterium]|nr:HD domain-containing protein [Rhodospirillales bacterium]